jgi:hypothetical protein
VEQLRELVTSQSRESSLPAKERKKDTAVYASQNNLSQVRHSSPDFHVRYSLFALC